MPLSPFRPRRGLCWFVVDAFRIRGCACRRKKNESPSEIAETASWRSLFSEPLASAMPAKAVMASFASVVMPDTASDVQRPYKWRGTTRPRCARSAEYRTPASRPVVPHCPAPPQIKDTLAGYRTAKLSDSPRASFMPPVPAFDHVAQNSARCCSIAWNRNSIVW